MALFIQFIGRWQRKILKSLILLLQSYFYKAYKRISFKRVGPKKHYWSETLTLEAIMTMYDAKRVVIENSEKLIVWFKALRVYLLQLLICQRILKRTAGDRPAGTKVRTFNFNLGSNINGNRAIGICRQSRFQRGQ